MTQTQEKAFLATLHGGRNDTHPHWKRRRDRAMMAVMIGAGLTVSEVISLRIENVAFYFSDDSVKIHVPHVPNSTSQAHDVIMEPLYAVELHSWRHEHRAHDFPSNLLFPANERGVRLNPATLYRQVKATFVHAGLESIDHQGGRTLRNTFAVRELANGRALDELYILMGHRLLKTTKLFLPLVTIYRTDTQTMALRAA